MLGATPHATCPDPGVRQPLTIELTGGALVTQGTGDIDQLNTIFKLLGTPSEHSWPKLSSYPAMQAAIFPFVDVHTISLGPDGQLLKMPRSSLRKKFPTDGYSPTNLASATCKTTALSDAGFDLLSSTLTCDPAQRISADAALDHSWFSEQPTPVPLTRSEIRLLRRNRDDAINSGAHHLAIQQQHAKAASKVAAEHAAAIAATIKERMGL